jgi:glucan phosphorylase
MSYELKNPIVVEVAMEIAYPSEVLDKIAALADEHVARACAMSNSVGGIGPLLKERIPAMADQGMEVIGVSLLYDMVWIQGFYPWGQIFIKKTEAGKHLRKVLENTGIEFDLELPDQTTAHVKVWRTQSHKAWVYFLDCPEISNVVYPGPEDAPANHIHSHEWVENQKLKQSWLAGRGALALLKHLNKQPDILIQSETPTFFANHFLVTDAFQKDPFFEKTRYIFNDHTPLEYAHPIWNEGLIKKARMDPKYSEDKMYWNQNHTGIDVTRLLIGTSHAAYGVSKKHEQVMKNMPSLQGLQSKITSITNGVSIENWQAPEYRNALNLTDEQLIALKEKKKQETIQWIWKRYHLWYNWKSAVKNKCLVLWTRRVTGYKRFDVLDHLLANHGFKERFLRTDLAIIVGGRLHQNDDLSQNVMFKLLDRVNHDPALKDRVVVIDNYNIWDAPKLFSGVDATIMLADDGREASATGFMKAQVNGAVVIACKDGAIPESVFFDGLGDQNANGFEVSYYHGQPQPEGLLKAFEALDQIYKNPKQRAQMLRAAFKAVPQVSVDRTAREMIKLFQTLL